MEPSALEFTAPCPCGHPDAGWAAVRRPVVGEAADDYLADQHTHYVLHCTRCGDPLPQDGE